MPSATESRADGGRNLSVALILGGLYALSFLDRQLLSLLAEPIKADLLLTDTELGLLTGFAFALFYTSFGLPVAWYADRGNRVRIVSAACALWSAFTFASGLAQNVVQLALARVGVGIGEAGGSPPSYSIIADYFPAERRGLPLAIYSLGVPVGTTAGVAIGGWIAANYGWRAAFMAIGLFGCLYALFILKAVREPVRGRSDGASAVAVGFMATLRLFAVDPVLRMTAIAGSASAFVGYAIVSWVPAFLMRSKGMTLDEMSVYYSVVGGVTATIGTLLSGKLVDRFGKTHPSVFGVVPAVGFLLSAPFWAAGVSASSWASALGWLVVPFTLCSTYMPAVVTIVQNRVSPSQRSTTSAMLLLFMNIVGLGGGPLFVGAISDAATRAGRPDSLAFALQALTPLFLVAAFTHWLLAHKLKTKRDR
jgi:MFS family permease